MKAAIVEDNVFSAKLVRKYLESGGKECDHFSTGEEFLFAYDINGEQYDVIICDLTLGGQLSGADVLEAVIKRETEASLILLTSAYLSNEIQEFCKRCPVKFINKPITKNELQSVSK